MKYYTFDEAFEILEQYDISHSKQVAYRWVSNNLIKSEKKENKYQISEEELFNFIDSKKPKMLQLLEQTYSIHNVVNTLTEKIISIDQKMSHAFQTQAEQLISMKEVETKLNEVHNKLDSLEASIQFMSEFLISLKEKGSKNSANNKKKSAENVKEGEKFEQFTIFDQVEEEKEIGHTLPFNEEQIFEAMKSVLDINVMTKYKSEILNRIKYVLSDRRAEWENSEEKKKYKCLYSGKQFEMCKPFLKQTAKYVATELLEKDGIK
ncbi:helix-turn-helix domain-containing protein [Bacillus sp. AFS053548]|uniref:helix-turn-helix domain-containing protein n=1 Tax=Bacillus sp. AFS053548 TaxID=2033505 RepID=UPI000BFC68BE|nr:helix-turn-helix domain-containing protein [Bacillus sp. AFS053548]PGM54185.1 hypothetical protein CN946_16420 [Bacillus sp. AFS053548]